MASKQKGLSSREQQAVSSVVEWLKAEHEFQFAKNAQVQKGGPLQLRERILKAEIPDMWQKYQSYRSLAKAEKKVSPRQPVHGKILMNLGQSALKCAAAARGAYVWAAVSNGMPLSVASDKSFEGLGTYTQRLNLGDIRLPWRGLLDGTAQDAVSRYPNHDHEAYGKPAQTLVALTGMAISGLLEYQAGSGQLILPQPGVRAGILEQWQVPDLAKTN